jgi:hypothetical protein
MGDESRMIAACGLDCSRCDIFRAKDNPELAEKIADWFRKEQNVDVDGQDIGCTGCGGPRPSHWSPNCWILKCCVDEKGLEYCSQCPDFPCDRLKDWAKENDAYGEALKRLQAMQEKQKT